MMVIRQEYRCFTPIICFLWIVLFGMVSCSLSNYWYDGIFITLTCLFIMLYNVYLDADKNIL